MKAKLDPNIIALNLIKDNRLLGGKMPGAYANAVLDGKVRNNINLTFKECVDLVLNRSLTKVEVYKLYLYWYKQLHILEYDKLMRLNSSGGMT